MKLRLDFLLPLLFISATAWANKPLSKDDFAYGIDVALGEHQLYEFAVNESMYRYLQHNDLRDLRIFDEYGAMVPIKIIASTSNDKQEITRSRNKTPLEFFPVMENIQQPLQDLSVYVQRNSAGTIVNINSAPVDAQQQADIYYVVDLGETPRVDLHELEILWDGEKAPKSIVTVQTSDDLTHWQRCGEGAVFQLRHNQQVLSHNHVPVRGLKRYLKIQLDQAVLLGLNSIKNTTAIINVAPEIGKATLLKQTTNQFYYSLPGQHPIRSLRIYPQQDDAIYSINLFGSKQADVYNRIHFSGSIYKLSIGNQSFSTDPVFISNGENAYWRIDVIETNQTNTTSPIIEFIYYPHRIQFLSNQAGQYTIAFGSAAVRNISPVIPQEINVNDVPVQILNLSTAKILSGDEMLTPPQPPKNYQKLILWAVLALVLLLMGFMVMRLLRHMREAK